MTSGPWRDWRILIIEDEYYLADDLGRDFAGAGADVVGPVATVADALQLIAHETRIDGAVLDVNLGGEQAYAVADALCDRGVPFVIVTGYDRSTLPLRFRAMPCCEKPLDSGRVLAELDAAVRGVDAPLSS